MHGLEGFDLSQLEVGLSARGVLLGVVAGVARDGTIELEPSPARTAAVEGKTDLRVAHFRWAKGDTAIVTPALAWHGDMHAVGARRTLDSRVEVGTLHLDLGSHDVDLNGISDEASVAVIGNLADPEIELTQRLSVRAVEQDVVPEYPLGDLAFALSAERGPEGVVHISDMKVANGLGGTALAVTGNVDLGEGRRTLSVTTSLTQDLARLSTIPERFKGRGKVAVEANVTSPDLAHYRVRAAVKGEDVTVALPRAGIDMETANGEVPITVALEVGENGVAFQRSEKRSPYSMLRFADQHPLLSRSGFLSITRLKTPFVSIAPLVGNLEIEQNVISLRQFEMGVRGGSITGQCGLDWDGLKSTLELHVRASGVQSSHGEPFDGNIAVVISAADRTIDGRAEILRIGERHLLDLLDLAGPAPRRSGDEPHPHRARASATPTACAWSSTTASRAPTWSSGGSRGSSASASSAEFRWGPSSTRCSRPCSTGPTRRKRHEPSPRSLRGRRPCVRSPRAASSRQRSSWSIARRPSSSRRPARSTTSSESSIAPRSSRAPCR